MDTTLSKITCIFASALFSVSVMRINGGKPWSDGPFTVQVYLVKLTILAVILIATSVALSKKATPDVNRILKMTLVFTVGWFTATVLVIDGRKPWSTEPATLQVYLIKLMMVLLILTILDAVMFSRPKPLTTSATIKSASFNEAESEKERIKEEA